ncbi:MAG TPA: gliding motility-associated C-terminal domain-containing protein, partial [Chitinophagaceae bacterium]
MRSALLRLFIAVPVVLFLSGPLSAQNCINTGLNGTVIDLPCNQNCVNVPVRIPHLKSTSDYTLNTIAYTPYPYVTTGGAEDQNLYNDDRYSSLFDLPFSFCFYDSLFSQVSVSSNGLITFDYGLGACNVATLTAAWNISNTIPFNPGTGSCSGGISDYPRAAIMGVFQDLDPRPGPTSTNINSSPPDRKIEWRVEGTAPCRRFVVSYYKIGVFQQVACGLVTPATFQIVIYESTGIIEVFIENKNCVATSSNGGNAILGIQNWNRDKALAAPGKNRTAWTASNEGYRFTPSGGASRFVSCEVYDLGGTTPLAVGDTITTTPGLLDVTFPSFCPTGTGGQYVVKTIFSACDNPANELVSYDTITINKTNSLDATLAVTPTSCGVTGSGTATVTVPAGIGTAPYSFVLNPGNITLTGNSPQTFTALTAGPYVITVTDNSGGCGSTLPVTITSTGVLAVTYNVTNTSCTGAANGSITVNPPNGTPPITYSINGGPFGTNNVYSNLLPGTYFISTHDAAGCVRDFDPVTVTTGPPITMTFTTTPSSCPGANNGTITITSTTGTAPVQYAINGGPFQTSNTFTGLQGGATYFIDVRDAIGCTISFFAIPVAQGTGTVTGTAAAAPTACAGVNNGSITVTPTSGTGPYQYSLNGGPYQTSNTFSGLAPGNYTVTIREAGLCTSAPIAVTVTAGAALTATVTPATTSCNGAADGTITITPTSGTGPYTFILDGTVTQLGATTVFNGVSSGAHSVVVRDALGCQSAPIPVTVTAGPALTGTATSAPTACPGVNNGSITATASNGTGPYTYALDGGAPQASNIFNAVSAGPHNVVIRTAAGCISANIPITVNAGSGILATVTPTSTACTGVNNGTITVTPTNGTGPYTFVLNGTTTQTGATANFTGVATGSHTITVTDAIGCITAAPLTTTVTAGGGFTATFTSANSSCTGAANGSITITPGTGGTGPYTFVLGTTTQTGAANTTFNNLISGTYSVLITDANGCQFTLSNATVNANTGFTAAYTSTTTSCSGAANGSITVTPGTGGTGPYTFVLGTTTQTGATNTTFNNLASGTYSVLVTDANGCQFALNNANVTAGAPLNVALTPVNTTCPGVNNGTVAATPANGNGPYTFVLDGTVTQTGATTTTFTGLAAGPHTMVVTDVNGCSINLPLFTIGSGSGITANVNPVSTSCSGATNGSIAITPTNGTGPYTFVLNGTTTQTGATTTSFGNLAAGNAYSIVITDAIGCTGTFNTINVPQGSALLANAAPVSTTCSGASNGQITVTPTNGAGPYTFVLNGTTTQTGAINTLFAGLAASTYSIVVTDAAGCVSSPISSTVNPGAAITITPAKVDAACFGSSTGSITATASANATAPVEFSLDNTTWQTATSFTGLAANTYTVYIRDAAGCTNSAGITVGQPLQLAVSTTIKNVLCNNQSNGVIRIIASGGTPVYSYSLDNITFQAADSFAVPAGNYTVYVRDARNCLSQVTINVTEPNALTATAVTANATCDGGNDGTITVTPAGGTLPYQYAITGGSFQATSVLNAGPGTYDVTVRDANGCSYQVNGAIIGLTNNLTLTPAIDPAPICEGNSTQLQLTTNATQFAWTPATNLSSSTIRNPMANPKITTSYSVVVTLGRCTLTDDILVSVMAAPVPDAGVNGDICVGQSYTLQPVGDPSYTYTWSPATYLSSAAGYNVISTPGRTTTYTLSVTDNNGCPSLTTDQVTVNVTPPIQVNTYPTDTVVFAGAQVPLLAISGGTYYTWSPAAGLDNPNIANPVATAPAIDGAVVTYQVTTTTDAGCQGDGSITIRVYKGPDIYVPNAFTPNNDGRNDQFIPYPVGIKQLNYFRVFNRWGQLLYSTTTLNKGWDGRLGGVEQASGVYVWMVEGVTMDNRKITKKGT